MHGPESTTAHRPTMGRAEKELRDKVDCRKRLHECIVDHLDEQDAKLDTLAANGNVKRQHVDLAFVSQKMAMLNEEKGAGNLLKYHEVQCLIKEDKDLKKEWKETKNNPEAIANLIRWHEDQRDGEVLSCRVSSKATAADCVRSLGRQQAEAEAINSRTEVVTFGIYAHLNFESSIQSGFWHTGPIEVTIELATKKKGLPMSYKHYRLEIVEPYKVQIVGWPVNIPFVSPCNQHMKDLKQLYSMWVANDIKWVKMKASKHKKYVEDLNTD
ncbi:hypothetical protein Moror_15401 [Moniliophthora roreri MCA 2997]|uniref:Uncharacterized protein n=1 Tax=Moniliophthora roreri (strain MCA 2997) TaxID=1381753 RepID=V2XR62_MONRO|nr:hypothetical protein Moror_15401 [Moniliophthora roreri MCA 2997]